jgi:hypothetical protein
VTVHDCFGALAPGGTALRTDPALGTGDALSPLQHARAAEGKPGYKRPTLTRFRSEFDPLTLGESEYQVTILKNGKPIKTIAQKIDEMIASYEQLNEEANTMFDLYLDELRLTSNPGIPHGSLKQMVFNRASSSRDMVEALKILRERKCPAVFGGFFNEVISMNARKSACGATQHDPRSRRFG